MANLFSIFCYTEGDRLLILIFLGSLLHEILEEGKARRDELAALEDEAVVSS